MRMYMYICVCMYVCLYVCMYVFTYMYIYACICMNVYLYVYVYVYVHVSRRPAAEPRHRAVVLLDACDSVLVASGVLLAACCQLRICSG